MSKAFRAYTHTGSSPGSLREGSSAIYVGAWMYKVFFAVIGHARRCHFLLIQKRRRVTDQRQKEKTGFGEGAGIRPAALAALAAVLGPSGHLQLGALEQALGASEHPAGGLAGGLAGPPLAPLQEGQVRSVGSLHALPAHRTSEVAGPSPAETLRPMGGGLNLSWMATV
jgi:hypothetical protein